MQEGPHWYFQDYTMEEQIWWYNTLTEFDMLFAHNDKDVISVQDMHDYSNDFSRKYYDKFIEKSTLCKFFKKKNFPIKQKRFSYNRVNCFIGLKYLNAKDEVSAF